MTFALIALLAPFALAFALAWIPFLLGWVALDLPQSARLKFVQVLPRAVRP